ncbi:MAG: ABC transporter, permease protein 1 (cluster 11, riboflavin/purine nucleoside/unknown), partial [uncultured Chloroflexia bacterium]
MKASATTFGVQWVRRERSSPRLALVVPVLAVLAALAVGAIMLLAVGQNPFAVYAAMLRGAFGSSNSIAETLVKTIPLILTGLGVSIAFRMLLWNIGAEGQLHFGAIFATGTGLYIIPNAPAALMIPLLVLAGFIGGAFWGLIPGFLRAYLKVSETITTLMLNYIAILFTEYLVYGPWKNPEGFGFPGTRA